MAVRFLVFLNVLIYIGFVSTLVYIVYSNIFVKDAAPVANNFVVKSQEKHTLVATTMFPKIFSITFGDNKRNVNEKPSSKVPRNLTEAKTFGELSIWLCRKERNRPKNSLKPVLKVQPCPDDGKGIVTVHPGGRTGNALWEYTGVMALSDLTKLKPYVPDCLKYKVEAVFENVNIPTLDAIAHCPFNATLVVNNLKEYIYSNNQTSIIVPQFKFQISLIMPMLKKIKRELSIREDLKANAQDTLIKFVTKMNGSIEHTFVGVHARRTDYINYLLIKHNVTPVPFQYFDKSMKYFKSRYKNCFFVYASDDPTWCFEHFGHLPDVAVPSYYLNRTAEEDLVLLAACNHTISDYGTYGEWAALLAGGETIYAMRKLMPHWIKMS